MPDDVFELEEAPEYDLIEEDTVLEAKIISAKVETTKMTDDDGSPVKQVNFKFGILDEPYEGRFAWGRTSTKFTTHPNCKLRAWVTEILGYDTLPIGFKFVPEDLVDQRCRIVMAVDTWEDKKAGPHPDTGEYPTRSTNKVKEVYRSRQRQTSFVDEPF